MSLRNSLENAAGIPMNLFLSVGPASRATTSVAGLALSRLATTDPAEPVPTTT